MKIFASIAIPILLITFWVRNTMESHLPTSRKINGVSLVSPPEKVDSMALTSVKRLNSDWVAIIPYAFSRNGEPEVHFNHPRQWWGEREEGTAQLIDLAHMQDLKVMLKPHVWLMGEWIGNYQLTTEEEWTTWEESYMEYILTFARLAEVNRVALFCIGTEYNIAVANRPYFWRKLIRRVRAIYSGEITYAANWDDYHQVSFWSDLDYIGIDAYFPLVQTANPKAEELLVAWEPIKEQVKNLSLKHILPVLFTEYGYQSVNGAAGNHWEVSTSIDQLNLELQCDAYEALYQSFWEESWFAGGFLWKWHLINQREHGMNTAFTPQGKPVEQVIARWYAEGLSRRN